MKFSPQTYRDQFVAACLSGLPESAKDWFRRLDDLADGLIAAEAADADRTGEPPLRSLEALGDLGALGIQVPEEYGGLGFGDAAACLVVERVAQCCASTAAVLMFHYQVVRRTLSFGSGPWRGDDLRGFATGTLIGASAWTEKATTKNKENLQTRLSSHDSRSTAGSPGDRLSLEGEKTFCTGLSTAGVVHVLADTHLDGERQGPTFVRVGTKDPRVRISAPYPLLGLRASGTASVEFDGVELTRADLVGEAGSGRQLMGRNHEVCLNPGLLALGAAAGAFEDACLMATGRLPETQPRTGAEHVRAALADTLVRVETSYAYAALAVAGSGPGASPVTSSKFKLQASAAAEEITAALLHTVGSRGFLASFPLERRLRDARATALMGPSNELIRDRITDHLLTTDALPEAEHDQR
ncbi:acyl-CoA/acyl-ACP dehydrogenase [Streptomyces sp. SCA3-4]|uniref:acyl-CoA dehydrogenase family protein n=1 Tax=Streptomyces sichuanensis TaxID=2871810 RepID=UPI001CE2D8FC|nr:acyl-CoA dehydrogenase family protein [Streptomyces sichuanensis]MCA6092192.1 acyl-CoA/acyl-ACP dehydrogenase [Streptomyces sichuanensis]